MSGIQDEVRSFDEERGWQAVKPEHTYLHLIEELGEVARELLTRAGYKESHGRLADELADAGLLLYKLAAQTGVDLEAAMRRKLAENERRFPLAESRRALERYLGHIDED